MVFTFETGQAATELSDKDIKQAGLLHFLVPLPPLIRTEERYMYIMLTWAASDNERDSLLILWDV